MAKFRFTDEVIVTTIGDAPADIPELEGAKEVADYELDHDLTTQVDALRAAGNEQEAAKVDALRDAISGVRFFIKDTSVFCVQGGEVVGRRALSKELRAVKSALGDVLREGRQAEVAQGALAARRAAQRLADMTPDEIRKERHAAGGSVGMSTLRDLQIPKGIKEHQVAYNSERERREDMADFLRDIEPGSRITLVQGDRIRVGYFSGYDLQRKQATLALAGSESELKSVTAGTLTHLHRLANPGTMLVVHKEINPRFAPKTLEEKAARRAEIVAARTIRTVTPGECEVKGTPAFFDGLPSGTPMWMQQRWKEPFEIIFLALDFTGNRMSGLRYRTPGGGNIYTDNFEKISLDPIEIEPEPTPSPPSVTREEWEASEVEQEAAYQERRVIRVPGMIHDGLCKLEAGAEVTFYHHTGKVMDVRCVSYDQEARRFRYVDIDAGSEGAVFLDEIESFRFRGLVELPSEEEWRAMLHEEDDWYGGFGDDGDRDTESREHEDILNEWMPGNDFDQFWGELKDGDSIYVQFTDKFLANMGGYRLFYGEGCNELKFREAGRDYQGLPLIYTASLTLKPEDIVKASLHPFGDDGDRDTESREHEDIPNEWVPGDDPEQFFEQLVAPQLVYVELTHEGRRIVTGMGIEIPEGVIDTPFGGYNTPPDEDPWVAFYFPIALKHIKKAALYEFEESVDGEVTGPEAEEILASEVVSVPAEIKEAWICLTRDSDPVEITFTDGEKAIVKRNRYDTDHSGNFYLDYYNQTEERWDTVPLWRVRSIDFRGQGRRDRRILAFSGKEEHWVTDSSEIESTFTAMEGSQVIYVERVNERKFVADFVSFDTETREATVVDLDRRTQRVRRFPLSEIRQVKFKNDEERRVSW